MLLLFKHPYDTAYYSANNTNCSNHNLQDLQFAKLAE